MPRDRSAYNVRRRFTARAKAWLERHPSPDPTYWPCRTCLAAPGDYCEPMPADGAPWHPARILSTHGQTRVRASTPDSAPPPRERATPLPRLRRADAADDA